jgi:hypothetical protein
MTSHSEGRTYIFCNYQQGVDRISESAYLLSCLPRKACRPKGPGSALLRRRSGCPYRRSFSLVLATGWEYSPLGVVCPKLNPRCAWRLRDDGACRRLVLAPDRFNGTLWFWRPCNPSRFSTSFALSDVLPSLSRRKCLPSLALIPTRSFCA